MKQLLAAIVRRPVGLRVSTILRKRSGAATLRHGNDATRQLPQNPSWRIGGFAIGLIVFPLALDSMGVSGRGTFTSAAAIVAAGAGAAIAVFYGVIMILNWR